MPHHPNSLLCNFFLFSFGSAFRRKEVKKVGGVGGHSLSSERIPRKRRTRRSQVGEKPINTFMFGPLREIIQCRRRRPNDDLRNNSSAFHPIERITPPVVETEKEKKKEEEMLPCISSFVLDPTAKLKKRKKKKRNERMEGTRVVAALSARSRDSASLIASIMFYSEPFNRLIRK